eukprot:363219-Chlamydomonas_euryale.AAC.7
MPDSFPHSTPAPSPHLAQHLLAPALGPRRADDLGAAARVAVLLLIHDGVQANLGRPVVDDLVARVTLTG